MNTLSANDESLDKIARDLYQSYATESPYEVFPDARDFMDRINSVDGVQLGAVTNFDKRIFNIIEALGLRFDFVVCSEAAKSSKPNRGIFDQALRVGHVEDGKFALHIGDDLRNDYHGSQNAGWNSIWLDRENAYDRRSGQNVQSADHVCKDFHEISEKVKGSIE